MEIDLTTLTPDIRTLEQMKAVLADPAATAEHENLYFMYRGLEEKDGLRYDITVIPAQMLGSEFVKTKGHYHVGAYGEVYMVLQGEAIYLMQKKGNEDGTEISDVYAVKAKKGDVVVIPSFYGHITINPSKTEELKMANWVSKKCISDYSLYETMQGACQYYTEAGWIKNEKYAAVPELRFEEPSKSIPENLEFLNQG